MACHNLKKQIKKNKKIHKKTHKTYKTQKNSKKIKKINKKTNENLVIVVENNSLTSIKLSNVKDLSKNVSRFQNVIQKKNKISSLSKSIRNRSNGCQNNKNKTIRKKTKSENRHNRYQNSFRCQNNTDKTIMNKQKSKNRDEMNLLSNRCLNNNKKTMMNKMKSKNRDEMNDRSDFRCHNNNNKTTRISVKSKNRDETNDGSNIRFHNNNNKTTRIREKSKNWYEMNLRPDLRCHNNNNKTTTIRFSVYPRCHVNKVIIKITTKRRSISHKLHNKSVKIINGNISGIKILHWNKGNGHLIHRTHVIENLISTYNPSIICLNELNLKKQHQTQVQFKDFSMETDNLINTRGMARTGVLLHKDIKYTRMYDHEPINSSVVILKLGLKTNKKFVLIAWYRQWSLTSPKPEEGNTKSIQNQTSRFQAVIDSWENLITQGYEVITVGDINLDSLKWDKPIQQLHPYEKRFFPMINYLHQKILNQVTHKMETGITWKSRDKPGESLDFVFTNYPSKLDRIRTHPTGESDHSIIITTKITKKVVHKPRYYVCRDFSKFDKETFDNLITNDIRYNIATTNDDPDVATDNLQQLIIDKLDLLAPLKKTQIKNKATSFSSEQTKEIQTKRNEAYAQALLTSNQDTWRKYRNLRNQALNSLRNDQRDKTKKLLNTNEKSPKEIWKDTKRALKWEKSLSPRHLIHKGIVTDSPIEMSNILNNYYIDKVDKIIDKIPTTTTNPLDNYRKLVTGRTPHFSMKTITMSDLMKTVNSMKSSNSTGIDNIPIKTIKKSISIFAPPILNIVNSSITTNTFPNSIKTAKIIPLLKSTDKEPSLPASYRPINLVIWLSKIIENVYKQQILKHLQQNNLIPPQHSGGLRYNSTTTNVATLLDMWTSMLDQNHDGILVQLDQSAAYDVVLHKILIEKLKILGFDQNSITLMKSYCSNRHQIVNVEGFLSEIKPTGDRSVMQGSVMSTLLYLIYVLDFPYLYHKEIHNSKDDVSCTEPTGISFVDDLSVTIKRKENQDIQTTLDLTMNVTRDYMNANKLSFNKEKTKIMAISRHPDMKRDIKIVNDLQDEEDIRHSKQVKILGIWIKDNLKMNYWIEDSNESLLKMLRTRVTALKKISHLTDFNHRRTLANALFQSKLVYGINIWGNSPKYMIQKIQVEQNNVARLTIGHKATRWSQDRLMNEMNWINIQKMIILNAAIMIHQVINTKLPEYFHLTLSKETTLPTRSSAVRKLGPKPHQTGNTNNHDKTFLALAYERYNSLPDTITAIHNKKIFKTKLKRYLKNPQDVPDIDDPNYTMMIPEETLRMMNPNIDWTHRRKRRKTTIDFE